mgnify:CR=1 FL=1
MSFGSFRSVCVVMVGAVLALSAGCTCPCTQGGSGVSGRAGPEKVVDAGYEVRRAEVIEWLGGQGAYNGHVKKVTKYAELLNQAREKPADPQVVEIGALLHDCGYQIGRGPRKEVRAMHAELGAAAARGLLPTVGFGPEFTDHVARVVHAHHSVTEMDTPEWKVVWMADLAVNKKVEVTPDTAGQALSKLEGMLEARRKKNEAKQG